MKKRRLRFQEVGMSGLKADRGISLLIVMLALLVLSVLAAAMIFTARSETFASYNYRLDTEADYMAKAGIQEAVNWFRSGRYQALSPTQAPAYYNVTSDGSVFNLLTANSQAVQCLTGCPNAISPVQLIGYGSGSSNYPNISNSGGTAVASAFSSDLVNVAVTGDASHAGTFSVSATLLNYQTVNTGQPPNVSQVPIETWLVTSQGTWTGNSGSRSVMAQAVEQAIIQPVYTPTFGNAVYGYCSVTMQGSSGVCTDSFNSSLGQYAGGNNHTAAGACDSSSTNVIASGAGVGSNGSVTLGSNVTVAGNVTIGTGAPPACGTGYNGSTSSVLGEVVNGPYKTPLAVPTFPNGFPNGAPSYSSSATLPAGVLWPPQPPFPNLGNAPPLIGTNSPCMTGSTCNGTAANPFEINSISISGNGTTIQLIGGPSINQPVYYDIASLSESGKSSIQVSGYVVLNIQSSMSITGNGVTNGISGVADIPPEAVQINYAGTSGVSLGGNGAISALINAPNATVSLGGGGSGGYIVGSINANNVSVQGGYPVHYDLQLNRFTGTLGTIATTFYSRQKM